MMKKLIFVFSVSVCLLVSQARAVQSGSNTGSRNLKSAAYVVAPNALQNYQPVKSSRNLLKNGGFEKEPESKLWIHDWGKPNAHHFCDSQEKHSGRYSLRIGNVPKSFDFAAYQMGKITDLKHDLLIRGWFKYKNVQNSNGSRLPFFGLWTGTKDGRNAGYRKTLVKFHPGEQDWTKFEFLIKVEDIQKKSAGYPEKKRPETLQFRINMSHQPGTVWLDDLEVIPLKKK